MLSVLPHPLCAHAVLQPGPQGFNRESASPDMRGLTSAVACRDGIQLGKEPGCKDVGAAHLAVQRTAARGIKLDQGAGLADPGGQLRKEVVFLASLQAVLRCLDSNHGHSNARDVVRPRCGS